MMLTIPFVVLGVFRYLLLVNSEDLGEEPERVLLGDLPILGALFRSSAYRRQETELLVVVTAHLVQPLDEKPALPGEKAVADPGDVELFLLGRSESIKDDSGDAEKPAKKSRKSKGKGRRDEDEPVGAVGFAR